MQWGGGGVKDLRGQGPRADQYVCLWRQADFQLRLPRQGLAPGLGWDLPETMWEKELYFPFLILELGPHG